MLSYVCPYVRGCVILRVRIRVLACSRVRVHIRVFARLRVCVFACLHVCVFACLRVRVFASSHVAASACFCTCARAYLHACALRAHLCALRFFVHSWQRACNVASVHPRSNTARPRVHRVHRLCGTDSSRVCLSARVFFACAPRFALPFAAARACESILARRCARPSAPVHLPPARLSCAPRRSDACARAPSRRLRARRVSCSALPRAAPSARALLETAARLCGTRGLELRLVPALARGAALRSAPFGSARLRQAPRPRSGGPRRPRVDGARRPSSHRPSSARRAALRLAGGFGRAAARAASSAWRSRVERRPLAPRAPSSSPARRARRSSFGADQPGPFPPTPHVPSAPSEIQSTSRAQGRRGARCSPPQKGPSRRFWRRGPRGCAAPASPPPPARLSAHRRLLPPPPRPACACPSQTALRRRVERLPSAGGARAPPDP